MEFMEHPENTDNGWSWSEDSLSKALKMRQIWQDSLKHENNRIHSILQDAWFPYLLFIKKYLKPIKPGYEIEANVFISDRPKLVLKSKPYPDRVMEPCVEIMFYWLPMITEDDVENDKEFEILQATFNKREQSYLQKVLKKFSSEIGLPSVVIYE